MSNGTQEHCKGGKDVTFSYILFSSLYEPISHTCCVFLWTCLQHLPSCRTSWKAQEMEMTLEVLKSPINSLSLGGHVKPFALSIRQSLVLPTIALTYPLSASLPTGHKETTYTTQSHARTCPGRPLYKDPSTTLLTSSKNLLDPDPAAKHLFLDSSPLCSNKASICNSRLNVVFFFYSSSTKHTFLHHYPFTQLSEEQWDGKETLRTLEN